MKQAGIYLSLDDIYIEANRLISTIDELWLGYYPYFKEGIRSYPQKLQEATNLVLDVDIALYEDLNAHTIRNMKN